MDSVTPVPAANKKKPFAIASITLILGAFFVLGEAFMPIAKFLAVSAPNSAFYQFFIPSEFAAYLFVVLCIFCVAAAMFFKKSNIFLIVSLFALALAYAVFVFMDLDVFVKNYSFFKHNEDYSKPIFDLCLNQGTYILAEICFVLGFIILGLTAIFARMGKAKAANLWILALVLFAAGVLFGVVIAGKAVMENFETLAYRLEIWLKRGVGDILIIVLYFFARLGSAFLFCGVTVMHFVSSILTGLYLKKLAK